MFGRHFGRAEGTAASLANQYYRRGLELRGQASLLQSEQSVAFLREAARIDPSSAKAWGALAWGYRSLLEYGTRADAEHVAGLARSAARRALELNPSNADARATLLLVDPIFGRWRQVEQGCREQLRQAPGFPILLYNLAFTLSEVGCSRASLPAAMDLIRREPFWPLANIRLFHALSAVNRVEEAEQLLDEALSKWPRRVDLWITKVRHLELTGRHAEALRFAEDEMRRPVEHSPAVELETVAIRARAEDRRAREAAASRIAALARREGSLIVQAAAASSMLGQFDQAFAIYDGYFFGTGEWGEFKSKRLMSGFLFARSAEGLQSDARFTPLLHRLALERYWRETGRQPDYRS